MAVQESAQRDSAVSLVESAARGERAPVVLPHRNAVEMFNSRIRKSGPRNVFRSKINGTWQTASWADWDKAAREIAAGLVSLGVLRGDRVAILSNTRAEWMHADVGILMAGAVTVPIYQSNTPGECEYILNDSESHVVFVDGPAQIEKLLKVKEKLGGLTRVVWFDDSSTLEKKDAKGRTAVSLAQVNAELGDKAVDADWLLSITALREAGKKWLGENAGELERRWEEVKAGDLFTIVYTSGTTGPPKGVMLTHENIVWTCATTRDVLPYTEDDEQLLFLPLAHIFAKILEWGTIENGAKIAFAESVAKVVENLGETKPSFLASVPRVFEKVYTKVQTNRANSTPGKRRIFDWAMSIGRRVSALQQQNKAIPFGLELKRRIAHKLVFSKIQSVLGGRVKFMVSGGAPLAKEIAEFFHAVGLTILEGYGLTETTAASYCNRLEGYRFGTVGTAIPDLETKIAEDGEILLRAPSVFKGYFNQPQATSEVIDPAGWFHTGDIGVVEDGFLRITDRKKDIIVTAGGKNVAPQNLENALKTTPYVSQVMVHGDKRPYLVALVTLNEENVRAWATAQGITTVDFAELSQRPEVKKLLQETMDRLNAEQPPVCTIKKFAILPEDFSQDTGELTPTLKVKRKFTTEKHWKTVDGLYKA